MDLLTCPPAVVPPLCSAQPFYHHMALGSQSTQQNRAQRHGAAPPPRCSGPLLWSPRAFIEEQYHKFRYHFKAAGRAAQKRDLALGLGAACFSLSEQMRWNCSFVWPAHAQQMCHTRPLLCFKQPS